MRKKNSRTKTKIEETVNLESLLNEVLVKLHNICYPIEIIQEIPVSFKWISQKDTDFTVHFRGESEEYVLTFSLDDITIKSSEELSEMILKDSKILVKEVHNEQTAST